MDATGRVPPHNDEAEQAVLGSMIRDNRCIPEVLVLMDREHFWQAHHQKVFGAVCTLHDLGQAVDLVTLANLLHRRGEIQEVQYPYLGVLWDAAPTAANVLHYARIVRDLWTCRRLAMIAQEIYHDASKTTASAANLLEISMARIQALAESWPASTGTIHSLAETIDEVIERIDRRSSSQRPEGIASGWIDLDHLTGGFQNSELTIVAARPSVGKTSLGLNIGLDAAKHESPILFVSLEQSRLELVERLLCLQAKVNSYAVRRGTFGQDTAQKLLAGADVLRKLPFWISDAPAQTMAQVESQSRRLARDHKVRMIIVDYIGLIADPKSRRNRQEQTAEISRQLKALARILQIPVLAMAQLNRQVEQRGDDPRLSDLRDSGAVEQDADTVIFLHRDREQEGLTKVIVAKQRNGPVGQVYLTHRKEWYGFEDHAPEDPFIRNGQGKKPREVIPVEDGPLAGPIKDWWDR